MNGHRIHGTPIVVDFWRIRQCAKESIFFLSHAHADHCQGLTSSWSDPIYTSEFTAKIATHRYGVASTVFRTLEIGCPHLIEQLDGGTFTVTLFDANHCPGAVMFIFEGQFGIIMYTGDFRYCSEMSKDKLLTSYRGKIDKLYLDNTYCAPAFDFPPREEVTQSIIALINHHQNFDVVIGIRELGKEDLLQKIAVELKEYIVVTPNRHTLLSILGCTNVFVTSEPKCNFIQTAPFHHITPQKMKIWNRSRRVLVIMPTALYIGQSLNPFSEFGNVFVMPYSDHSSYKELHTFVSMLNPKMIFPIVTGRSNNSLNGHVIDDMSCFSMYLTPSSLQSSPKFTSHVNVERRSTSIVESRKRKHFSINKRRSAKRPSSNCNQGVVFESCSSESESDRCRMSVHNRQDSSIQNRQFSSSKPKLSNGTSSTQVPEIKLRRISSSLTNTNSGSHSNEVGILSDERSKNVRNNIEERTNVVMNEMDSNEQCREKKVCHNNDTLSPDLFTDVIETVATRDVRVENVEGHCENVLMKSSDTNNNSNSTNYCTRPSKQSQKIQSVNGDVLEIVSECSDISLPSTSTVKSKANSQVVADVYIYDDSHVDWKKYQDTIESLLQFTSETEFARLHTHFKIKSRWLPLAQFPED